MRISPSSAFGVIGPSSQSKLASACPEDVCKLWKRIRLPFPISLGPASESAVRIGSVHILNIVQLGQGISRTTEVEPDHDGAQDGDDDDEDEDEPSSPIEAAARLGQ